MYRISVLDIDLATCAEFAGLVLSAPVLSAAMSLGPFQGGHR